MTPWSMLGQVGALFTAPALATAGVLAVSIPIAIHLLSRLRRKQITWAAMQFLEEAWKQQRRRLLVEQWLLLAVRCLLLVLLGLALSGPQSSLWSALGLSRSPRLVCIILDNSLPTMTHDGAKLAGSPTTSDQADNDAAALRFKTLQDQAMALVDGMSAGDELALWTAAQPIAKPIALGAIDRSQAKRLIADLKPSFAQADLAGALQEVRSAIQQKNLPADRAIVAVISDFPQGTLDTTKAPPQGLTLLQDKAQLWLTRPGFEKPNVQISGLASSRSLLLVDEQRPLSIPLTVQLTRYAPDTSRSINTVTMTLRNAQGQSLQQTQRIVRWTAGQSQTTLNVQLPAEGLAIGDTNWVIEAQLDSPSPSNDLTADDQRYLLMPVRQTLRIGLLAGEANPTGAMETTRGSLSPTQWLELALSPAGGRLIQTQRLEPMNFNNTQAQSSLEPLDAIIILGPSRLQPAGWQTLATLAQAGKLVWVFPEASEALGQSLTWTTAMQEAFKLTGSIEPSALTLQEPQALATENKAPEALEMLAPDWQALLTPLRMMKLLKMNPQHLPQESRWLTTADGRPALISVPVERGQLLVSAFALDDQWTNLMLKPLFVPLVHEALHGVLGQLYQRKAGAVPAIGQRFNIPEGWKQATQFQPVKGLVSRTTASQESSASLPVEQAAVTFLVPGIYQLMSVRGGSEQAIQGAVMAVNTTPAAGNTQANATASIARWFGQADHERWIDPAHPSAMLQATTSHVDLSIPLLWLLLAMVLLETALARRYSYGQLAQQGAGWLARWWQRQVRL